MNLLTDADSMTDTILRGYMIYFSFFQWEASKAMGDCFAPLGPDGSKQQTNRQTDKHGDSMTELAQLGRFSEKIKKMNKYKKKTEVWQAREGILFNL